jgi:hypothetical protein
MVIWHVCVHLLVWLAWTDPHSSNCCCSDCFSSPMPMKFLVRLPPSRAVVLEMRGKGNHCEPLTEFSVVPSLVRGRDRQSLARDWREMRWTVLWVVREVRVAAVQKLPRRRGAATRRGISVAANVGSPRCVCRLRHRSVELNWTVNERWIWFSRFHNFSLLLSSLRRQNNKLRTINNGILFIFLCPTFKFLLVFAGI